jgi:hypothetical protein
VWLRLPQQSTGAWYRARLKEERDELRHAATALQKLSESSDVLFAISRARYDGIMATPPQLPCNFAPRYALAYPCMLTKYTLRWSFYRRVALLCKVARYDFVCEVVNPSKDSKLDEVARRHGIDSGEFRRICAGLRRVWPLLPSRVPMPTARLSSTVDNSMPFAATAPEADFRLPSPGCVLTTGPRHST